MTKAAGMVIVSRFLIGRHKLHMAHSQSLSNFIQSDDRGVSFTPLKSTQILLAIAGTRFYLLLCQAFFLTETGKITSDQSSHIHAIKIDIYIL